MIDISNKIAKLYINFKETGKLEIPTTSKMFNNQNIKRKTKQIRISVEILKEEVRSFIDKSKEQKSFVLSFEQTDENEITYELFKYFANLERISVLLNTVMKIDSEKSDRSNSE
jgi:hypothetical protein